MVINGPTPIMSIMLSAVASRSPISRASEGCDWEFIGWEERLGQAQAGVPALHSSTYMPGSDSFCFVPGADQIYEQANRARHACGELGEEGVSGVDISALAVVSDEQAAVLRRLAGIVRGEQRLKVVVPLRHEIEAALLHPSIKIFAAYFVGKRQNPLVGSQNFHRLLFNRNTGIAQRGWPGRVMAGIKQGHALVVLHDQGAAAIHVVKKASVLFANIRADVIGADADDDRVIPAQVAGGQFLRSDQVYIHTYAAQHGGNLISRTHDVADLQSRRELYIHGLNVLRSRMIGIKRIQIGAGDELEAFGVLFTFILGFGCDLVGSFMQVLRSDAEKIVTEVAVMVQIDGQGFGLHFPS